MITSYKEQLLLREKLIGYAAKYSNKIIELFKINHAAALNYITRLNNCKEALRQKGKITIKRIFELYWDKFYNSFSELITRPSIKKNVDAMLGCGKFENGYLYFECQDPSCTNFHLQPLTCKSRFCPSCGKKYNDARVIEISKKCLDVKHRHIVFTVPEELRIYFRLNRELIDCLFEAVNQTFNYISLHASKKKKYKFGFISTLHTFGRDMKFNPHIHALIAEVVIDKDNNTKSFSHFHYEQLRKSFQYALLSLLSNKINTKDFSLLKSKLYNEKSNGFYVYAPPVQTNKNFSNKQLIEYIVRYAGHPAISQSRILSLNTSNDTVTYYYDPHEDENINKDNKLGRQYVTEHVFEFIKKLIVHIPDDGKHNIRYYGFYANKSSKKEPIKQHFKKLFSDKEIARMKKLLYWRFRLINSFNYDILNCEVCGKSLVLVPDLCFIPKLQC